MRVSGCFLGIRGGKWFHHGWRRLHQRLILRFSMMEAGAAVSSGPRVTWAKPALILKPMCSASGLRFSLDPASAPPSLRLCSASLAVVYRGEDPPSGGGPASSDPGLTLPGACADVIVGRGQYYWEVEVCNSSVYRVGKRLHAPLGPTPALCLHKPPSLVSAALLVFDGGRT